MLILISDAFDASLPEKLTQFGEVTTDKDRLPEADVVLIRSKTKATKEYIDSAPKMKLIIRGGVGIDNIDSEYAASKGIEVRNTPKASGIGVAELAFAMMIAVPNHIVAAHKGMTEGKWLKKELKRTELHGKTVCLLGAGNIAMEFAKRAKAFGMTVKAYRKSGKPAEYADVKPTLAEALEGAEYVSIHLPKTPETTNLVNADAITMMKDGVIVINTGRGAVVEADAMVKALEDGKVACYATDVWPKDPPADDYPILKAPNVLMIPHLGASSKENLLRVGAEALSIVEEFKNRG
jgi:D-3-phosphoglycerate dehydrogenase / 2-oxoglutarate reductase